MFFLFITVLEQIIFLPSLVLTEILTNQSCASPRCAALRTLLAAGCGKRETLLVGCWGGAGGWADIKYFLSFPKHLLPISHTCLYL